MHAPFIKSGHQAGLGMIEVLVALVVLMLGLLGLAGMMMQSQRSETESYQRVQALILVQDMAGRINANRKVASCYAVTSDTDTGTPFLGADSALTDPTCTAGSAAQNSRAVQDLTEWNALLLGAAETSDSNHVGAMIKARGCVSYDAASGNYLVTVAWQGMGKSSVPPAAWTCAQGTYGKAADNDNDRERRAVSVEVKIANLG